MSFIRTKKIKGISYCYRVKSVREGDTVRQVHLEYLGRTDKLGTTKPNKSVKLGTTKPNKSVKLGTTKPNKSVKLGTTKPNKSVKLGTTKPKGWLSRIRAKFKK